VSRSVELVEFVAERGCEHVKIAVVIIIQWIGDLVTKCVLEDGLLKFSGCSLSNFYLVVVDADWECTWNGRVI
jgi:hypothetical protein